ncbi:uncharacterized protein LOC128224725 [Mya arenaria]|nr:uncharacterized protein LOC128224725 [Mya arenaria]XP_052790666.1 uncharacterized protein LOC128224725 [Mya arenaria]
MQFEEKDCIVLSVFLKGWIPFGFEKFDDKVGNYSVDVREFQGIDMQGDKIDMLSQKKETTIFEQDIITCTMQGCLKRDDALTCAHGVLSESNLRELKEDCYSKEMKEFKNVGDLFEASDPPSCKFGTIKDVYYGNKDDVFVDIAVIEPNVPMINLTDEIRKYASDFEIQPICKLSYQENCDDIRVRGKTIVIKYGCASGLTFGVFSHPIDLPDCNKLDVLEIDGESREFSHPGDSGAFLLKVDPKIISNTVLEEFRVKRDKLIDLNNQDGNGVRFQKNEHFQIIGIVHGCAKDDPYKTYCTRITPSISALRKPYYFCS